METTNNLKKQIIANHQDINNVMQWIDEIEDIARQEEQAKYSIKHKHLWQYAPSLNPEARKYLCFVCECGGLKTVEVKEL